MKTNFGTKAVKNSMLLCVFFIAAIFTTPVFAVEDKPDTPTTLEGGKVISVEEAKALVDKKGAKFFDMRSAINFGKGHLPGATALPYKELSEFKAGFDASKDQFDLSKLPSDKNTTIVFYSDGPSGWKSYKAAVLAKKAGYKKVMWLREGTKGWEAKKFPLQQ
jgi:rhodanese-related sulfurtransferase